MEDPGDIPFSIVSHQTWLKLANKLDIRCSFKGNDWRMLAEELGYSTQEILVLEEKRSADGRNTMKLFEEYVKRNDSMVGAVKAALEKMKRDDALKILEEDMPAIRERYQKQMQSLSQRHPVQVDCCSLPCLHSHASSHVCYNTSSMHFMCSSGAPSHRDNFHSNYPPYPSMPPPSPCCRGVCHPSSCQPGANCHGGRGGSNCGGGGVGCGPCGMPVHASPGLRPPHHPPPPQPMECSPYHSRAPAAAAGRAYGVGMREEVSMTVHTDGDHLEETDNSMDTDDIEEDGKNTEHPASLPRTILRGQEKEMSWEMMNRSRQCPPFARQVSEECNAKQPTKVLRGEDRVCTNPKKRLNVGHSMSGEGHNAAMGYAGPLEKLQNLANLPEKYMPNEDYKTVVAEQKIEEVQMGKERTVKQEREDFPVCQYTRSQDSLERPEFHSSENLRGRSSRNGLTHPKTFPQRLRPHPVGVTMGELQSRDSQSSPLTKSLSMPIDMKVAEFRKAFRNIEVFVTYSIDNKKHLQRILSLCSCLEKNGFNCSVDIYCKRGREVSLEQRMRWFEMKFYKADFVLVCISPKYKMDVDRHELMPPEYLQEEDSAQQQQLHTCHFYRMMVHEFQNNNHRNKRFIPLMFESATKEEHVPSWLVHSPTYHWPSQYKDLLWMLTKPEERIKPKTKSYSRNRQSPHFNSLPQHEGGYPASPQHPHNSSG